MFADRTPAATMRTNQLRLWFASMAYVLMCAVRRIGLAGTQLAQATCGTIRQKLLKIGARVTVSVRRVRLALASACPYRDIFLHRRPSSPKRHAASPPSCMRDLSRTPHPPANSRATKPGPSEPPPPATAAHGRCEARSKTCSPNRSAPTLREKAGLMVKEAICQGYSQDLPACSNGCERQG